MADEFGYAGKILKADLTEAKMDSVPASDYADRFISGRAIAAKMIQGKIHTGECLIFCALFYPLRSCDTSATHKGDPAIESRPYSAVTGGGERMKKN